MRTLNNRECRQVAGGVEVGTTLRIPPLRPSPVGALLGASFLVGYEIGTAIYNAYTAWRY